MDAFDPAFVIREARESDCHQLLELARELDSINLPTDSRAMHWLCWRAPSWKMRSYELGRRAKRALDHLRRAG